METLNTQVQPFFEWLLRMTLQASLMVCLILLLQRILRSKLGIRWHYSLWLLLLVRMSLPWAPQSRVSLFNLIPRSVHQQQIEYVQPENSEQKVGFDVTSPASIETVPASPVVTAHKSPNAVSATPTINQNVQNQLKSDFSRILKNLPVLWLTGALILAVYVCAGNFNLWRIVKSQRPLIDQKILELLEDCKSQMGIQTILGIVTTDKVKSPALFGFVRPRLLLPTGMIENLSREELRFVFLHELAHLKRRDIYIGWLISVLQVLHWFNPLVWLAFRRMRADRELACDALVLDRTQSDEPKSYGRIIVSLLERFSCPKFLPGMAGILETKSQLKRRITMIAKFKNNSYKWSPIAVVLIIILACISLPDAVRTKASQTSDKEYAPPIILRRIWAGPDVDCYGAPSPDGRYISFVDWETSELNHNDLAIYEIATGKKRRLTDNASWYESDEYQFALSSIWSPDGKQIAYQWWSKNVIELCVIGIDGSKPRILYGSEEWEWVRPYDWSPDGRQILACVAGKDGKNRIVLVSVADGSVHVLKTLDKYYGLRDSSWYTPKNMSFSPDGRHIVYDFPQKEDSHDISLMSSDGSREIPLVEHPAGDYVLGWAPDGKNVIFASDRTGTMRVWLIAVADGKPRGIPELVMADIGRFGPMGLTEDGSFYYSHSPSQNKNDVYITKIDPETGKIIVPPHEAIKGYIESNTTPDYSPDGKYLAYISRRPPPMKMLGTTTPLGNVLCIRSLETGEEREFKPEINSFGFPQWSPDSHSIMVVNFEEDNKNVGLYRIDAQTGKVKLVVMSENNSRFYGHLWCADGRSIFMVRSVLAGDQDKHFCQIVVRNIESGVEKELYRGGRSNIFSISLSPDGKWLAFLDKAKNRTLRIMPATGGEPREIHTFDKEDNRYTPHTWTADGKYILMPKFRPPKADGKWDLWRIPVDDGEPQNFGFEMASILQLSAHPDGQHIAFCTTTPRPAEVWVMENFLPEAPVAKSEPTPTLRQIEVRGRGRVHSRPSFDDKYMLDVDKETGNLIARELATGKERTLINNADPNRFVHGSLISPDSKNAAFYHFNPNKDDFDLQIVGIDGSNLRTLLGAEIAGYFNIHAWSPDGKYIFGKLMKKPVQLARISLDDGSLEVLKTFEQGSVSRIDASPDGRYIAYSYAEQETSNPDIFIYDLEQNREAPLVRHSAGDKLLAWTPDGRHIFFTSDRNGTWDGWLQRVVDGKPDGLPEIIKAGMGNVSPIGFTQSGSFYYAFNHEAWNVYTAKLDQNTGQVISEPVPARLVGKDFRPDFSPDGRYLAYLSQPDRTKPQVIRIRTLATGQERELKPDLPRFERLRWCPDSRHLLITFFRSMGSPSIIYKLDIRTGKYTVLAQIEDRNIRQAELSADGKTLIYRKRGLGYNTPLIARDIETGSENEIFQFEGAQLAFWSLSPDGKEVAYSIREGEAGNPFVLKIISMETGESKTLVQDVGPFPLWSSDGRDVLFTRKLNELWRISAEGGEPQKLFEWKEMIMAPRIHPDGQRIAFHSGGYVSEMWVMENFLPETVAVTRK